MSLTLNKYTNLTHNKQWGALLPDQEKFVALTAEVKTIKVNSLKLYKILNSNKESSNKSSKGKSKDKCNKKGKSKKLKIADKYKWKTVPLKDNDLTKDVKGHSYHFKIIDNKEYYWCQYHATCVMHEPEGDGKERCHLHKQKTLETLPV